MSSFSNRTMPGPGSAVHLSFTMELSLLYTLPQTQASFSRAAHSLRQASVRRLQDCTRRCGGNGVSGGILGSPNRHAPRSLRRSFARRLRKGTGLLGSCGVVGEVQQTSVRRSQDRALCRHAPRSLRRSSARRLRKGTGLLGSCGVVGEVMAQHPPQGVICHASRSLRLALARRSRERRRSYRAWRRSARRP